MHVKKACLVINPRAGQNIAKLTDVLAVLSAAGWKANVVLKEYGGQTMELATEAAEDGCDLVIGYGGDGTLSNVVNGVMNVKGQHSIVGIIPGGTANVWAGEVGIPDDPVKAALTLANSEARKVDIGHVEVESLLFPDADTTVSGSTQSQNNGKKSRKKKVKTTPDAKHHFLLMAGIGIDAAIMGNVSKPLKYSFGPLAVGVSAMKELPAHKAFPLEIRTDGDGGTTWKGEALQVVIGNTRKYGNIAEMTPDAYIDDGVLDVIVITAGNPLSTMQQITSVLLRQKTDNTASEHFHGSHMTICAPASVAMQLDGSAVKLKDYISKADQQALEESGDLEHVMVRYRFDSMPHSLQVAIPNTYTEELFEHPHYKEPEHAEQEREEETNIVRAGEPEKAVPTEESEEARHRHRIDVVGKHHDKKVAAALQESLEHISALMQNQGRKVTVFAVAPDADKQKQHAYIIAGHTPKPMTGEDKPVAVTVDDNTTIMKRTGEQLSSDVARDLQAGGIIVVEGKKSKRGVIHANRLVVM